MYINIYIYIYMLLSSHVYANIYIYVCVCIYICLHLFICVHLVSTCCLCAHLCSTHVSPSAYKLAGPATVWKHPELRAGWRTPLPAHGAYYVCGLHVWGSEARCTLENKLVQLRLPRQWNINKRIGIRPDGRLKYIDTYIYIYIHVYCDIQCLRIFDHICLYNHMRRRADIHTYI